MGRDGDAAQPPLIGRLTRSTGLFAGTAVLLTLIAMVAFTHAEARNAAYDSLYYLQTTDAFHQGSASVPASVPSPFRYRILAPWLAGRLPLPAGDALQLMTYVSLCLTYFFTLHLCTQLGIGRVAAVAGLSAAYASPTHLGLYFNPLMTDAFGLLLITVLLSALVADAVWTFGIAAVFAPLAREVALFLLPVWCIRSWQRGLAIAFLAIVVFAGTRWMIGPGAPGPIAGTGPEGPDPTIIGALRYFAVYRLQHLDYLALDARNLLISWGWVWVPAAVGLMLVRANQVQVWACAIALLIGAFATVAVAGDVLRLFGVLFPVMAVGTGLVVDAMIAGKQRAWLGFFGVLVVLQFFFTAPHMVRGMHMWSALAPHFNILRIGFAGMLVGAVILRHDVMRNVRHLLRSTGEQT